MTLFIALSFSSLCKACQRTLTGTGGWTIHWDDIKKRWLNTIFYLNVPLFRTTLFSWDKLDPRENATSIERGMVWLYCSAIQNLLSFPVGILPVTAPTSRKGGRCIYSDIYCMSARISFFLLKLSFYSLVYCVGPKTFKMKINLINLIALMFRSLILQKLLPSSFKSKLRQVYPAS